MNKIIIFAASSCIIFLAVQASEFELEGVDVTGANVVNNLALNTKSNAKLEKYVNTFIVQHEKLVKDMSARYTQKDSGNNNNLSDEAEKLAKVLAIGGALQMLADLDMIADPQQAFKITSNVMGMREIIIGLIESNMIAADTLEKSTSITLCDNDDFTLTADEDSQ